jgi:hypothetical protein
MSSLTTSRTFSPGRVTDLEALFGLILLTLFFGFCFWKYPVLMKEIFSFKKKPVEPVQQEPLALVPGKAVSRINEPTRQKPVPAPNHEIIRHDYYNAYNNELWPQWVCKCGGSGYIVTTRYEPLTKYQRDAHSGGAAHVAQANEADENLRKSNGKFAF